MGSLSNQQITLTGGFKMDVHINYPAVLIAALANYIIGTVWYGGIFSKTWKNLTGISEMKPTPASVLIGVIGALLMSYVLAHAVVFANGYMKTSGLGGGLMCGFFNWLGFIAPVTVGMVIYEKKSWKLWILNNAYWLISLLAMGAILSAWK
jgi:hypothetical protein